jgi:hypothetical protein
MKAMKRCKEGQIYSSTLNPDEAMIHVKCMTRIKPPVGDHCLDSIKPGWAVRGSQKIMLRDGSIIFAA